MQRRPHSKELIANQTTAMVITYNEAPNLERCLDRLGWAKRVLVVDSGSTDETLEIVQRYPKVDVVHRDFDDFASQCNFGLSQIITPWVLSLDADYELSEALLTELLALPEGEYAGYSATFVYRIYGRSLRASLYPPRVVLYRRDGAAYRNEGHGHRVTVAGPIASLRGRIFHDDRKPLSRWLTTQQRYATREADFLLSSSQAVLSHADRLRLMGWPAPLFVFFHTLLCKRCVLDGWPGWIYVLQRTAAEILISLEIAIRRMASKSAS
jgi:glycosyltransferase involved in cell wall biosynthesis